MRKFVLLAVLMLAGVLLSGCLDFQTNAAVNEDGSGTWELGLHFNEDYLREMGETGDLSITDQAEGLDQTFTDEESGIVFTTEARTQNDDEDWLYIVADVPNLEAWEMLPDAFMRIQEAEGGSGGDTTAQDDLAAFLPSVSVDGNTYRVEFTFSADALQTEDSSGMFEGMDLSTFFSFTYTISLPGEITDTNGTIDKETGAVKWELDVTSQEDQHFFAESSN